MKFYRIVSLFFLGIIVIGTLLGSATSSHALDPVSGVTVSATVTPAPQAGDKDPVDAASPGVLEQFGPPGVLITTTLTGILMIIKSVNEGKKIDVTTYKERAADAETRSNAEIGKVHKKLEEVEAKLDEVIADRDEYRETLEDKKAFFTQQVLEMERRHQRELEDMHSALMVEIHVRHRLERLLAENGIQVPDTPPPYTRSMQKDVTDDEKAEVAAATNSMRVIRESEITD